MVNYTINLHYDGCFVSNPFQYLEGNHRVVENIDFEGVIYSEFCHIIRKLVLFPPVSYFYVKTGVPLSVGLKQLQRDEDFEEFVRAASENNFKMDIYCDHSGYNVMEMLHNDDLFEEADDLQYSDIESQDSLGDVNDLADFETEDDSNVDIPKTSTQDPWLNKLIGKGKFIGHMDNPIPNLNGRFMLEIDDPDQEVIDSRYKAKKGVEYPAFDPETPWDQCKPFLGMRFETPAQLKQCLANYGVAHGYQLWYMQNDIHKLQMLCGRDVSEGRCAGKRGKKDNENDCDSTEGCSSKVKNKNNVSTGEPSKISKETKERWAKKKEEEKKRISNQEECKFRLWASWMSTEKSFQIKTLYPEHNCCRNYNLGALVTYKWIAHHYAREIIYNPWLSYQYMQNSIREKYLIDVSLGQCKRAKQRALFDHEGGLVDHYSRVWEYRQPLLESNPGSTCHLDLEEKDDGLMYFKRMYICFLGLKDGWKDGCRKVIGLDGCFLTHTCKGQLLTAMGRDANNQMFPIAWGVVRVENKNNWCWFLSLLHYDLALDGGKGLTIISDAHKGLIEAVSTWLPDAEHRQCTRHIYANFKRKWSGLQWKRLFWSAAACTLKEHFLQIMEQIKMLDEAAHKWLVERNPNSWSRAFFEMDRDTSAFENGISESFNARILNARGKPLITMLEDIRIYLMQRVYYMNKKAMGLEDTITPSIRKQLECLKRAQRYWQVVPSAFQEVEVRKADEAFCVNLHTKRCLCRKWEMSGIPCVHAVAGYLHMKMDPELGVSQSYSKNKWIEAYKYGIRPVFGSKTWKPTPFPKPLPPLERKMPGRPRKQRIRHPTENDNEISRVGRIMHCHKCWEAGHNKKSCKNLAKPKPPNFYQHTPAPEQASNTNEAPEHFAEQMPVYTLDPVLPKQKASPTRGSTSQSRTKRGRTASIAKVLKNSRLGVSTSKQYYITPEEHAFMMDQEALVETLRAEEAEQAAIREIWRQNEENSEPAIIPTQHSQVQGKELAAIHAAKKPKGRPKKATTEPSSKPSTEANAKKPPIKPAANKIKGKEPVLNLASNENKGKEPAVIAATNKNKGKELVVQPSTLADAKKPRGMPKKATTEPSSKPSTKADAKKPKNTTTENIYGRIYFKNRGRSERIANQNKPFKFDKYGNGSAPDKAFSVD